MNIWLIILIIYTCISLILIFLQELRIIEFPYKSFEEGIYIKDIPWREKIESAYSFVKVLLFNSFFIMLITPALLLLFIKELVFAPVFGKTRFWQWFDKQLENLKERLYQKEQEKEDRGKQEYIRSHPNKFRDMKDVEVDLSLASTISFSTDIPFRPLTNQIIYIEDEYNAEFNDFFRENEEEIRQYFNEFEMDFIYLPTLLERFKDDRRILFACPLAKTTEKDVSAIRSDVLNKHIKKMPECEFGPCLIRFMERGLDEEQSTYTATYRRLLPSAERSLERQIHDYFSYKKGAVYFNKVSEADSPADNDFYSEWAILMDEIRERVEKLRLHGVEEAVISSLFKKEETLSRMVITKDFRIYLTDYDNMEIKMKSLPKAVYLLFLNHPEGIRFKELTDYRKELMQIYNKLTNRSNNDAVLKSIEDLTDPTKNSINEKCARIRGAFLEHFGDPLVRNYCITGLRGEPKKIVLPRELVTFE